MDIQGYILDHWKEKMKPETPVLIIYDKEGIYHDLLPLAEERGYKVIDTTKGLLHARLSAARFWCSELSLDKETRMIIYRNKQMPANRRDWVEEPFSGFVKGAAIFPYGPQDDYKYICRTFLPTKLAELDQLFATGSTSFNMINALLDGAVYPELEQLTGGKSFTEMTVGLLSQTSCPNMQWMQEWQRFADIQFPGLHTDGISLHNVQQKLWAYLLFSEFVFDLPEELPDSMKSIAMAPIELKDKVYLVCDKLRNQQNLREIYVRMANKIAELLRLRETFAKVKHLGERVTFCFENVVEYQRFINKVKEGKLSEAHMLYRKNIDGVWYNEDAEVATFWKLAKHLLTLIDCINLGVKSDGSMAELIAWYAEQGCEADFAFRRFHTEKMGATSIPDQVKELTELVNTRYREFTERSVKTYQQKVEELKNISSAKNQGCVEKVYPALNEGKRVVFVMVDAFRYEMGKNFSKSIKHIYSNGVDCDAKVSFLPSVTRFGMANHLGDITLELQEGKLQPTVDGASIIIPDDRISYLENKTGVEIQDVRLEDFDPTAIHENTRLLVVRSVGIDVAGENDKLDGLAAMEIVMNKLARLLVDCRRLKFDLAVLVADHGFMIQPVFRVSDQISKPVGSDIVLEERRMIAGNLNESENTLSFTPAQLGLNDAVMKFCFAKGFTVFKRGEVYYHEGLSLQENIVPMISVRLQEEKERHEFTIQLRYKDKMEGTVYSRRPIIDINVYFEDLFVDDVNIRLKIVGDNGSIIGKPEESKFYNNMTELVNIPAGVSKVRQPISIDDEYVGTSVIVTALDTETNATLSTLKLNFENE